MVVRIQVVLDQSKPCILTISIATRNVSSGQIKVDVVYRVHVTIKRLDTQTASYVPDRDGFVPTAGAYIVCVWLEADMVNTIDMTAECLPAAQRVEVPKLGGVVHGGTDKEVAAVMKIDSPHGLRVVRQRRRAGRGRKVPKLHSGVPTACCQVSAAGVEGNAGNPLLVAFARHYQIAIWHAPKFPSLIVTNSC